MVIGPEGGSNAILNRLPGHEKKRPRSDAQPFDPTVRFGFFTIKRLLKNIVLIQTILVFVVNRRKYVVK